MGGLETPVPAGLLPPRAPLPVSASAQVSLDPPIFLPEILQRRICLVCLRCPSFFFFYKGHRSST